MKRTAIDRGALRVAASATPWRAVQVLQSERRPRRSAGYAPRYSHRCPSLMVRHATDVHRQRGPIGNAVRRDEPWAQNWLCRQRGAVLRRRPRTALAVDALRFGCSGRPRTSRALQQSRRSAVGARTELASVAKSSRSARRDMKVCRQRRLHEEPTIRLCVIRYVPIHSGDTLSGPTCGPVSGEMRGRLHFETVCWPRRSTVWQIPTRPTQHG